VHSAASSSAKSTLPSSRHALTSCSIQRTVAAIRCALLLAVLSAVSLYAAGPAQAQTETVIYNFCPDVGKCPDGGFPDGLTRHHGKFYGTTYGGGASEAGTVFELSPNGRGGWNETVLYTFCPAPNCPDGALPGGPVIFDSAGNLYGLAAAGGVDDGGHGGYGVVFELSPAGSSWTETVLYTFAGGTDGAYPGGLIMDKAGNLYGTVFIGGYQYQYGVFELSPSGNGWTKQMIYTGDAIVASTMDPAGNIFGTGANSPNRNGEVFELTPNGNGGWNPAVISTFEHTSLTGVLVRDRAGNLYGTTRPDGAKSYGQVFRLSRGKTGQWTRKILHTFSDVSKDGSYPYAGVLDAAGNIYGTTIEGGMYGYGTVFELVARVGRHGYHEKVLWSFNVTDGYDPAGSLILDNAGNLYGTAYGGVYGGCGCGVVFKVTP
jgi:uncharacterized repeat protein (TIGR03803 family)